MNFEEKTLWGIHAGKTGDSDYLFLKKKSIGVGWAKIPDLKGLAHNREVFKELYQATYPNQKPGTVPVNAGQLFRFVHEMTPGDLVVYPSKLDKLVHVGEITSEYIYRPAFSESYPHQRDVNWLKSFPRTKLSQGALYELGSALSLFQVKNYADEYIAILRGQTLGPVESMVDPTVAIVADEIEQTTYDFVLKQLSKELKGHPLQDLVANILQQMGYQTRVSPEGTDGGIDIIAHRDPLGLEPPIIKVQVKSSSSNIGAPDVQALYGNIDSKGEYGLFVTLSSFTSQAKNFARGKSNLRLIDGDELVSLFLKYYEQLDAQYKGLIPLKRVYVPQSLEESSES